MMQGPQLWVESSFIYGINPTEAPVSLSSLPYDFAIKATEYISMPAELQHKDGLLLHWLKLITVSASLYD
jgi:hypothetical protein